MFCPNCGKDCGSAKFCPECGQKLQGKPEKEQKSSVWSVGMPCPHCGGTRLDGNYCAFCGAQLIVDFSKGITENVDSYEIPYGFYRVNHWVGLGVHIAKDYLLIRHETKSRRKESKINYNQLMAVELICNDDAKCTMTIYWRQLTGNPSVHQSLPAVEMARLDWSDREFTIRFYHVFYLLQAMTSSNVRFFIKYPPSEFETLRCYGHSIDMERCFFENNPHREPVIAALRREYALSERDARMLTDAFFNMRQNAIYAANPKLAIRDINRFEKERVRLLDEEIRKIDERSATRRRR